MGRLINLRDLRGLEPKLEPPLYFSRTSRAYSTQHWEFEVTKDYPYVANIHIDKLNEFYKENSNPFWINLRRWVERTCAGDMMMEYQNMSYRWWYNRDAKHDWDKQYSEIKHGYWCFYFENEDDLTMFALKHGEMFSKPQGYHPEYGENVLEQDRIYGKDTQKSNA